MFLPPDTDRTLAHTLHCLVQLQKELRRMLRECSVTETILPRHSLFSSRRVFRSDELHLGLNIGGSNFIFSNN
jgi:hypothetical protein